MKKFQEYLTEAVNPNPKKDHVEDNIFNGEEGYQKAVDALVAIMDKINGNPTSGKLAINYKGPKFQFGYDNRGQFFAKLNEKTTDKYTKNKFETASQYLPQVAPPTGVYEGSLMYTDEEVGEDPRNYFFAPDPTNPQNPVYGFQKEGEEGKKVRRAKVGITVDKKINGDIVRDTINPSLAGFQSNADIHIINPEFVVDKTNRNEEFNGQVKEHLNNADKAHIIAKEDMYEAMNSMGYHLRGYTSQTSMVDEKPTALGFKAYLKRKYDSDPEGTTTDRLNQKEILMNLLDTVDEHHENFENGLNMYFELQQAKNILADHLNGNLPHEKYLYGHKTEGEEFHVTHNGTTSKVVNRIKNK